MNTHVVVMLWLILATLGLASIVGQDRHQQVASELHAIQTQVAQR